MRQFGTNVKSKRRTTKAMGSYKVNNHYKKIGQYSAGFQDCCAPRSDQIGVVNKLLCMKTAPLFPLLGPGWVLGDEGGEGRGRRGGRCVYRGGGVLLLLDGGEGGASLRRTPEYLARYC